MTSAQPQLRRRTTLALLAALTALTLWAYHPVLDLALLGWDSWPMILTSRVQGLGDLWGIFSEELMDGRYPHGSFYRPVTSLSFALDHSLGGLDPAAYHRTDLLILVLNTALVALVARRLVTGRAGLVCAALAGACFCLHPVQLELVSAAPRRADTLCLAFTLGCLLAQRRGGERGRGNRLLSASLAALAAGSKETGAVVAPIVLAWNLCIPGTDGPLWQRMRDALRRSLPALGGVALYVVTRTLVLGGLGGHEGPSVETAGRGQLYTELLRLLFYPRPYLGTLGAAAPWAVLLLLLVLAALTQRSCADDVRPRTRAALSISGLWAACVLAMTGLADRMHEWYALLVLAPYCIALALILVRGLQLARGGRTLGGLSIALLPALLVLGHLAAAWPLHATPRLEGASVLARRDLEQLERGVDPLRAGAVYRLNPWHPQLAPAADGWGVRSLFLTSDYSLQAWCELRWPERSIDVSVRSGSPLPPTPGRIQVQLVPGAEPSWLRSSR